MKAGIAASLLVRQVKNTAAWFFEDQPRLARPLAAVEHSDRPAPLDALLTAHHATVATFVPTDVDARIRHHAWQAMTTPDQIAAALDLVDAIAAEDVSAVSARVYRSAKHGALSGHDGEWFSVRAGAALRAGQLGDAALLERIGSAIDTELEREAAIYDEARGDARATLSVATILAHNLGDLSRVVMEWAKLDILAPLRERWLRLGHPGSLVPGSPDNNCAPAIIGTDNNCAPAIIGTDNNCAPAIIGSKNNCDDTIVVAAQSLRRRNFVEAGLLNKAVMAHENHRFLPLRKPRGLRAACSLLLPIGPWLDDWGETIATHPLLEDRDRAEVLAALLEVHDRDAKQEGCLRAISGLHRATKGGIERYVPELPARMRKDAMRGKVRDALDITPDHFQARIAKRLEQARTK